MGSKSLVSLPLEPARMNQALHTLYLQRPISRSARRRSSDSKTRTGVCRFATKSIYDRCSVRSCELLQPCHACSLLGGVPPPPPRPPPPTPPPPPPPPPSKCRSHDSTVLSPSKQDGKGIESRVPVHTLTALARDVCQGDLRPAVSTRLDRIVVIGSA